MSNEGIDAGHAIERAGILSCSCTPKSFGIRCEASEPAPVFASLVIEKFGASPKANWRQLCGISRKELMVDQRNQRFWRQGRFIVLDDA
jgi:hypothetical protein